MKRFIPFAFFLFVVNALVGQSLPVGHVTLTFTDPTRGNREIPCEVYYPALLAGESQPVYAPVGNEQYPVVVFGHGFVMGVDAYEYLQNALASNGFIALFPTTETGFAPSHDEFAKDLAFAALSMLDQNNLATSLFHQRVLNSMATMGHSMGGSAAVLSFQYNPNFKTVFTLAAAETNPSAVSAATGISVPTVYMTGSNDCITPLADHQLPMYNAGINCRYLVTITDATHCQFANSNFACETGETISGCANGVDESIQHDIVLQWLLPWLDLHLRNNVSASNSINDLVDNPVGFTLLDACDNLNVAQTETTNFNVYPNADGSYRVVLKDVSFLNAQFAVVGVDGKLLRSGILTNAITNVDLNGFANGVYFLQIDRSTGAFKLINAR